MKLNKNGKKDHKFWLYLFLGGAIIELFRMVFKNKDRILDIEENFKEMIGKEKDEIDKLKAHKENVGEYFHDSCNILWDYFIPHECNQHKPKILRPRALIITALLITALKLALTGYLFFSYPDQAKMSELIVNKVFALTNADREANGLEKLTLNSHLNSSAANKASDMIERNYFAHTSPDGKKPWDWIDRASYPYLYVGENLAMNFTTADAVHQALMDSPSHRKNILNDRYKELGLAMATGELNGKDTSVLVEHFAISKASLPVPPEIKTETLAQANELDGTEKSAGSIGEVLVESSISDEKQAPKPVEPVKTTPKPEAVKPVTTIVEKPIAKINDAPGINSEEAIMEESLISPAIINGEAVPSDLPEIEDALSPNRGLEADRPNSIIEVKSLDIKNLSFVSKLIKSVHVTMIVILAFMALALLANIFIRVRIQHKPVIIQTLLLIFFITSMLLVNFHYLEAGVPDIFLL